MGRTAATTIRVLLVFLDLLTALLGSAVLGLAVYLYLSQNFSQMNEANYRMPLLLFAIMGVGGVMLLISVLGLAGACCRSYCCLMFYAALFCLIVVGQCIALLFAYVFKPNVQDFVQSALTELLNEWKSSSKRDMGTALDFVQSLCRCCGVSGFIDFFDALALPRSCCASARTTFDLLTKCSVSMLQDRVPGCRQRFLDVLYGPYMPITLGSFGGLVLLELALIIMACYLCHLIRKERD